jgi:hypothetical protein
MTTKQLRRKLLSLQLKKADIDNQIKATKSLIFKNENPAVTSFLDLNHKTRNIIEQILMNQKADMISFNSDLREHCLNGTIPVFDNKLKKFLLTLSHSDLCVRGCGHKTWSMLWQYINSYES